MLEWSSKDTLKGSLERKESRPILLSSRALLLKYNQILAVTQQTNKQTNTVGHLEVVLYLCFKMSKMDSGAPSFIWE